MINMNDTYNETKVNLNPVIIYQRMSKVVLNRFNEDCNECKQLGTFKDKFNDIVENSKYQLKVDGNWYFGTASKEDMKVIKKMEQDALRMLDECARKYRVN